MGPLGPGSGPWCSQGGPRVRSTVIDSQAAELSMRDLVLTLRFMCASDYVHDVAVFACWGSAWVCWGPAAE